MRLTTQSNLGNQCLHCGKHFLKKLTLSNHRVHSIACRKAWLDTHRQERLRLATSTNLQDNNGNWIGSDDGVDHWQDQSQVDLDLLSEELNDGLHHDDGIPHIDSSTENEDAPNDLNHGHSPANHRQPVENDSVITDYGVKPHVLGQVQTRFENIAATRKAKGWTRWFPFQNRVEWEMFEFVHLLGLSRKMTNKLLQMKIVSLCFLTRNGSHDMTL